MIFKLPSRIFPTGFFNSCSLVGHSILGVGGLGVSASGAFVSGFSGGLTGGTVGSYSYLSLSLL